MTLSPGPPPWPIPPSWTLTAPADTDRPPPEPEPEAAPEAASEAAAEAATEAADPKAVLPPERAAEPAPEPAQAPEAAQAPEGAQAPEAAEPAGPAPETQAPEETAPGGDTPTIALLVPDGAVARDVLGAVAGVTVEAIPLPEPSPGFTGVYELAAAVNDALAEGADGVVLVQGADALEETAWALELLHTAAAPLVLAADPGHATDVADAISVAAAAPADSGCLLVAGGEIHLARHARRAGSHTPVPAAGPLGYVTAGSVRLLWNPPGRLTVSGERTDGRAPRVGLHTSTLGDDGELLVALAERCDGLVVTATATGGVPGELADVLAEAATRIPVVLVSPAGHDTLPVTALDPLKARVLMHLLLATGRDRDAVLDAFASAAGPGPVRL
jgi:L-asparaginase